MIGLLQDPAIKAYDIIAVQEPWRNTYDHAVYNPRDSDFYVIDLKQQGSRVCTYVNKRISTSSWSEIQHSPDSQTITVRTADEDQRVINVHNVYSPPPTSHYDPRVPAQVHALADILSVLGEYILLGDFNLHHPLWAGLEYPS